MAQRALTAGRTTETRGRAFFGLLDAGGWAWASLKAVFWFVVMIFLLGYIPDRAYYFTVNKTLELGVLAWSPVNFCPPTNLTLPCPPPPGSVVPWDASGSPPEVALPAARTDGAIVQVGSSLLYVGGSDGTTATDSVLVTPTIGIGNIGQWTDGPALPEPRSAAGVVATGGSVYVVGGRDEQGQPTSSVFILTPDPKTGTLGEWQTAEEAELDIELPEARAAGALVAGPQGLLLIGGDGPNGPTKTVWKSVFDKEGALTAWAPQHELLEENADGGAAFIGDYLWLYGGRNANGATATVQRGITPNAIAAGGEIPVQGGTAVVEVDPEVDDGTSIINWSVSAQTNMPSAREGASSWAANGNLYLAGGREGNALANQLYWATPNSLGNFSEWKHLPETDLSVPLAGAAPIVTGPNVILVGGSDPSGAVRTSQRANLAPQAPFFQLGLVGATVPALTIGGEIGQQLGYLNAAGAGTVTFIILLVIGWMFAHKERTAEIFGRFRRKSR